MASLNPRALLRRLAATAGASALLLAAAGGSATVGVPRAVSPMREGHAMSPRWNPQGTRVSYEVNYPDRKLTELFIADVDGGTENRVAAPASAGSRTSSRQPVVQSLAWHPAGSLFSYSASDASGNFDVFVHTVAKGFGLPTATDGAPAFSPDGKLLAFSSASANTGGIYVLALDQLEKGPRALTAPGAAKVDPAWSPDGRGLVFGVLSDNGDNLVLMPDVTRTDMSRRLTEWKASQIRPSFSPDGRTVAFYSNYGHADATRFDLHALEVAGGAARRLAQDVIPNGSRGPTWTPDGQGVLIVQRDASRGDPICIAPRAGGAAKCLQTGTRSNVDPDVVARDGLWRIAFASQSAFGSDEKTWRRVYVMDVPPGGGA
ncbi:hypothetical protein L6R50_23915 [Myxococcota bacterium]|nr:hypothetical protein [Myxococcota bacterium]